MAIKQQAGTGVYLNPGPSRPMLNLSAKALQRLGNPAGCLFHLFHLEVSKSAIFPTVVKLLPLRHCAPKLLQQFNILHGASNTHKQQLCVSIRTCIDDLLFSACTSALYFPVYGLFMQGFILFTFLYISSLPTNLCNASHCCMTSSPQAGRQPC